VTTPGHGGVSCPSSTEIEDCNAFPCPVDCTWDWSEWGACTVTCGENGIQTQHPVQEEAHKAQHGGLCILPGPRTRKCEPVVTCPTPFPTPVPTPTPTRLPLVSPLMNLRCESELQTRHLGPCPRSIWGVPTVCDGEWMLLLASSINALSADLKLDEDDGDLQRGDFSGRGYGEAQNWMGGVYSGPDAFSGGAYPTAATRGYKLDNDGRGALGHTLKEMGFNRMRLRVSTSLPTSTDRQGFSVLQEVVLGEDIDIAGIDNLPSCSDCKCRGTALGNGAFWHGGGQMDESCWKSQLERGNPTQALGISVGSEEPWVNCADSNDKVEEGASSLDADPQNQMLLSMSQGSRRWYGKFGSPPSSKESQKNFVFGDENGCIETPPPLAYFSVWVRKGWGVLACERRRLSDGASPVVVGEGTTYVQTDKGTAPDGCELVVMEAQSKNGNDHTPQAYGLDYPYGLEYAYEDAGATCTDGRFVIEQSDENSSKNNSDLAYAWDLSHRVKLHGGAFPDVSVPGLYTVHYRCSPPAPLPDKTHIDADGWAMHQEIPTTEITRKIVVEDTTCPRCMIIGRDMMYIEASFPWHDEGARCTDNAAKRPIVYQTTGMVNVESTGTYQVTYTASDDSGNFNTGTISAERRQTCDYTCRRPSTAVRTVVVIDTLQPVITVNYNPSRVSFMAQSVQDGKQPKTAKYYSGHTFSRIVLSWHSCLMAGTFGAVILIRLALALITPNFRMRMHYRESPAECEV